MTIRAIFIGCVDFSTELFAVLKGNSAISVVGIVSKSKSDFNSDFVSLLPMATELNIQSLDFSNSDDKTKLVPWIQSLKPDIIFCCGWSHLLDNEVLSIPRLGVVGYHPAALPQNRGRHPIIWTLVLGLKETASTFFIMDEGADSGDIVSQRSVDVGDDDDASSLYEKLKKVAKDQFKDMLVQLATEGQLTRTPQDHNRATYWRKRSRADGTIDWRMSATNIHNLVRALTRPYPGAEFASNGKTIRVWRSKIVKSNSFHVEPGKIISTDEDHLIIKCGEDALALIETDPLVLEGNQEYL